MYQLDIKQSKSTKLTKRDQILFLTSALRLDGEERMTRLFD